MGVLIGELMLWAVGAPSFWGPSERLCRPQLRITPPREKKMGLFLCVDSPALPACHIYKPNMLLHQRKPLDKKRQRQRQRETDRLTDCLTCRYWGRKQSEYMETLPLLQGTPRVTEQVWAGPCQSFTHLLSGVLLNLHLSPLILKMEKTIVPAAYGWCDD